MNTSNTIKTVLVFALSWITVGMVSAKKPELQIVSGDICPFLQTESTVRIAFDYTHAMWEEDEMYKDFCGEDYESRVANSVITFTNAFNTANANMKATAADAPYSLVVVIDNLERKQGMSLWGRMFIRIKGTINVYDTATNELVLSAVINNHAGEDDFVEDDRLAKCFTSLATEFVELGKKCK